MTTPPEPGPILEPPPEPAPDDRTDNSWGPADRGWTM